MNRSPIQFHVVIVAILLMQAFHCVDANGQESAVAEASAQEKNAKKTTKNVEVKLARGLLNAKIPETWNQKPLRSTIIEREYAIAPVAGDENAGRLTMMSSGGTLKMNIDRWFGQFAQPDGKRTKDVAKVTEKKVGELKVSVVDIPGNFNESIGPPIRGKRVLRTDYRMLGAIVQAKQFGNRAYFFKMYGPKKTMAATEKQFMAMIESLALQGSAKKSKDKPSR